VGAVAPPAIPSSERTALKGWKRRLNRNVNASVITESGVLGDRSFALIDKETGRVVSAKAER
jgi:hypothetical protein